MQLSLITGIRITVCNDLISGGQSQGHLYSQADMGKSTSVVATLIALPTMACLGSIIIWYTASVIIPFINWYLMSNAPCLTV